MIAFSCSIFCALLGVRSFLDAFEWRHLLSRERDGGFALLRVESCLGDVIEELEAGWVPSNEAWQELSRLPEPWGRICHEAVTGLRRGGAAVVPSLRRLRELARFLKENGDQARSRSAQSRVQAAASGALVPVLGVVLDRLMPGVAEARGVWLLCCGGALLLAGAASLTLLRMVDDARWGGLPVSMRPWLLESLAAVEGLLAGVRSGVPADLVWSEQLERIAGRAPGLARLLDGGDRDGGGAAPGLLRELGHSVRQAMQLSAMEGRPCIERIETAMLAFRTRWTLQTGRELELLATRALQPLFLGVAPAILGMLGAAILIAWNSALGPEGGVW